MEMGFKNKKNSFMAIILTSLLFLMAGCSPVNEQAGGENISGERMDTQIFVLDTIVNFSIWDGSQTVLDEMTAMCYDYEKIFSKSIEGSDVYLLNHSNGNPIEVSDDTIFLLNKCIEYSELSDGYFDATILPVKDLWDFKSENPKVPAESDIKAELTKVDYKNIGIEGNSVTLGHGAQVDFGGIAKGYIADKIYEYIKSQGIERAIINLGGNILMVGDKSPGNLWTVGIQHPDKNQNVSLATVRVANKSVVTSGVYERYFEIDGKVYHHLINPFTGWPADNGIQSVSIISDSSLDGDVLSTTCFVLGLEKGMELIESLDGIEAVYVLDGMEIVKSSGIDNYQFELVK